MYEKMPLKAIATMCNEMRKMPFRMSIMYDPSFGPFVLLDDPDEFEEFFGDEATGYPTNEEGVYTLEAYFGGVMFKTYKAVEE